jgi:hypothetical protein
MILDSQKTFQGKAFSSRYAFTRGLETCSNSLLVISHLERVLAMSKNLKMAKRRCALDQNENPLF